MALRWFIQAMLSHILDPISDNTSKDQKPRNFNQAADCFKTERADFIVIPKKNLNSSHEGFQMPLYYPRYKKEDYEKMEEWRIDQLLREYGLVVNGSLEEKRDFAMGAFLWPDQMQEY